MVGQNIIICSGYQPKNNRHINHTESVNSIKFFQTIISHLDGLLLQIKRINNYAYVELEINQKIKHDPSQIICKINQKIKYDIDVLIRMISKTFKFNESVWVYSVIYLNRYLNKTKTHLSIDNYKALLYGCVVLSIKYIYDIIPTNKFFSKVIGILTTDLNSIELNIFESLDHQLYVNDREYQEYYHLLKIK